MKISVVTISFNQAHYLKECMDSVLSQDHPDIEYIVVDPGSTDGSRDIIDSYGDRVVRIYEKDKGPADGLNKGFARATGDVLCFLNSDDVFRPQALSRIAPYFDGSIDVLSGHTDIIDGAGAFRRRVYSDAFDLRAMAYGQCFLMQASTFFTAEIFRRVGGFNPLNRSNWDAELFIEFGLADGRFALIDEFLSAYRVHGESITGTGKLAELHRQYGIAMFNKVEREAYDVRKPRIRALKKYYKIRRHLLNYRDTIERIRKGPVFMSGG